MWCFVPGLPPPLVLEASLLSGSRSTPRSPRVLGTKLPQCFNMYEIGLRERGKQAFRGCLKRSAHSPGVGDTEGEKDRHGPSSTASGRQLALNKCLPSE